MSNWSLLKAKYGIFLAIILVVLVVVIAVSPSGYVTITNPPTIKVTVGHSPENPAVGQAITIVANAVATGSNVRTIRVFVDNVLNKTCNFNAPNVNCIAYVEYNSIRREREKHPYYALATNSFGKTKKSSVEMITLTSPSRSRHAQLTVTKTGTGSGKIRTVPIGIDCGLDCSSVFSKGTFVTLIAYPNMGSVFVSWAINGQNIAACPANATCDITMDSAKTVVANFERTRSTRTEESLTLTGSVINSTAVSLSWNSITEADSYRVQTSDILGMWKTLAQGLRDTAYIAEFSKPGTFTLRVIARDNAGNTIFTSNEITADTRTNEVTVANQLPHAAFTADVESGPAPLTVKFNASDSSDPDMACNPFCTYRDIANGLTFTWDFGDGTAEGTGITTAHTYATAGDYILKLTVTDNKGGAAAVATKIIVTGEGGTGTETQPATNQLPQAAFTANNAAAPSGIVSVAINTAVNFDASDSSDSDGTIASYAWEFGDGTTSGSKIIPHSYTASGVYVPKLTVTDNAGGVSTQTMKIIVTAS